MMARIDQTAPRRILLLILIAAVYLVPTTGHARPWFIGARGELATLIGGTSPHFYLRRAYGLEAGFDLTPRWSLQAGLTWYDLYTDTTLDNSFTLDGDQANADRHFSATRFSLDLMTSVLSLSNAFHIRGGFGGGLMIWEMRDPDADTTLKTIGSRNETIDFASTEIFLSGRLGAEFRVSPRFAFVLTSHADYLTGAGTDFADSISSSRDRWLTGVTAALRFSFGGRRSDWTSQPSWSSTPPRRIASRGLDSDGDGVPDDDDRCAGTPVGVRVDSRGCAVDSDGDGIVDSRDDCPDTEWQARGQVDIYGCPVDSDFDGIPDYLDQCPHNRTGAVVDYRGCPEDDDADGVPNGLDDCPNSLYGAPVDKFGCLDLSIFDEPMVLNIDYPSGSFEIDPNSKDRLRSLARVLLVAPDIRLEINGYTDNIGTEAANQALSKKRANRVRDFLVAQGVGENRISAHGRGETNFVASNDTAEGRAMNRRIEIVFYK